MHFIQKKEHISQQWQNGAQQDAFVLKISSLMCTDALYLIFLRELILKSLSLTHSLMSSLEKPLIIKMPYEQKFAI